MREVVSTTPAGRTMWGLSITDKKVAPYKFYLSANGKTVRSLRIPEDYKAVSPV